MESLSEKTCKVCEGGVAPLTQDQVSQMLKDLPQWSQNESGTEIQCTFSFKNYYHTMAFVNAIAYLAHCENHHPDLEVSYNRCVVRYSTHAINGLSENDFICAHKVMNIKKMREV